VDADRMAYEKEALAVLDSTVPFPALAPI